MRYADLEHLAGTGFILTRNFKIDRRRSIVISGNSRVLEVKYASDFTNPPPYYHVLAILVAKGYQEVVPRRSPRLPRSAHKDIYPITVDGITKWNYNM